MPDPDPFVEISKTQNWVKYASLLLAQSKLEPLGPAQLRSHGYRVDEQTGEIRPLGHTPWGVIKDETMLRQLRRARDLLKPLPRNIIMISTPASIESGCPHTYGDAGKETAYILFPGWLGRVVSLYTMVHECVHVYQKYSGKTNELYLNKSRIDELLNDPDTLRQSRLNPDANPIMYKTNGTDMLCVRDDERTAPLEKEAYDAERWLNLLLRWRRLNLVLRWRRLNLKF